MNGIIGAVEWMALDEDGERKTANAKHSKTNGKITNNTELPS